VPTAYTETHDAGRDLRTTRWHWTRHEENAKVIRHISGILGSRGGWPTALL